MRGEEGGNLPCFWLVNCGVDFRIRQGACQEYMFFFCRFFLGCWSLCVPGRGLSFFFFQIFRRMKLFMLFLMGLLFFVIDCMMRTAGVFVFRCMMWCPSLYDVDCFDVRVFWCSDIFMFGCFDVRMFWRSDVWMFGCFDVRMFWCSDVLTFGCFDFRMFWRSDVLMFGCFDVRMFWCSDVLMFGCFHVRLFWCPDVQMFWCSDVRCFCLVWMNFTHSFDPGWGAATCCGLPLTFLLVDLITNLSFVPRMFCKHYYYYLCHPTTCMSFQRHSQNIPQKRKI